MPTKTKAALTTASNIATDTIKKIVLFAVLLTLLIILFTVSMTALTFHLVK